MAPTHGNRGWLGIRVLAAALASAVALAVPAVGAGARTAISSASSGPHYYVALGDSIAAGYYASNPNKSYVGLIYRHESSRFSHLQQVSFACGGATTGSMILGTPCHSAPGSQLQEAESFLSAHRGRVALVTMDIGMNDIYHCFGKTSIDSGCITNGLKQVSTQLPGIVRGLTHADPGVQIVGMNYYDPFLVYWLVHEAALAKKSLSLVNTLNSEIQSSYLAAHAQTANVFATYQSNNATTGRYNKVQLPQSVITICRNTLSCTGDPHPNDRGHALIAKAFYPLLPAGAIQHPSN
jgi:lysophospholipase L1-like esterase